MSSTPTPQMNMDTRTPLVKSVTKSGQLLLADVAGNAAELAYLKYRDRVDAAFPFLRKAFHAVFCEPVRWFQKPIEKVLDHAENFEGEDAHKARMAMTDEQRLEKLVDASYEYVSAAAVGAMTLFGAERGLSKLMKTDHLSGKLWFADAAVHTGIVVYMGTPSMKDTTQKVTKTIEHMMVGLGWKPEEAKSDAAFTTLYIVPNYVNWVSNSALASAGYYGVWDKFKNLFKQVDAKASGQGHALAM